MKNGARHDVVVIGASAGGVEALRTVMKSLPPDLAASVFVVLHLPPGGGTFLVNLLNRACPLPVANPVDAEEMRHGRVYVAPEDHHMLVEKDDRIRIVLGPKLNRHRPAIDPLFESASNAFGDRVIGEVRANPLQHRADLQHLPLRIEGHVERKGPVHELGR